MRYLARGVILLLAAVLLPGCGGGGGSDGGIAAPPVQQNIIVQITAVQSVIPANIFGIPPFLGSPYIAQLIVDVRNPDGTVVANGTLVNVSVAPVEFGGYSTLDDPSTDDVNEFTLILGQGSTGTVSGQALLFFHSFDQTGTATVSVTVQDPNTAVNVTDTINIRVRNAANTGVPAQINFIADAAPHYVQGSGGTDNRTFQVQILDDGGAPVDPQQFLDGIEPSAFNNVRLSIVGAINQKGAAFKGGGPTLTGVSASGGFVEGETIDIDTTEGVATANLRSGTDPGTFTVQATADRADNNIDNGIQDPVSDTRGFLISDGELFSLTITTPDTAAIEINRVNPEIEFEGDIPPDPDGTYSLTVSVTAADRGGNPPVQPIEVGFGLVDSPVFGFPLLGSGIFTLSGLDGNPEEGGTGFFAPSGSFLGAQAAKGDAAGPGDTLVLLGEDVPGNADHESARIVSQVTGPQSLVVTQDFNLNNLSGVVVNDGPVIPYVVGRASLGNISSPAFTNAQGVATTQLNYPVSQLGRVALIYAQGSGGVAKGVPQQRTVADAEFLVFPGVAPAQFAVFAERIPANRTIDVLMCVADALGTPIAGIFVNFVVTNPGAATVIVDGDGSGSGPLDDATGQDGCAIATISSNGVVPGQDDIVVVFSVGGLTDELSIVAPTDAALFVLPSAANAVADPCQGEPPLLVPRSRNLTLILVDAAGQGIEGVQLVGACSAGANLITPPGPTDANGRTNSQIEFRDSATCTYATTSGEPSATFTATVITAEEPEGGCP